METIFNNLTRDSLVSSNQMIAHCILWDGMALAKTIHKRAFISRLIGPLILKSVLKDNGPLDRNVGSLKALIVGDIRGNFELLRTKWLEQISQYPGLPEAHTFMHPFFGGINREKTGYLAFKHIDHHLRQFGV